MDTINQSGYSNTIGMRLLESAVQKHGPIFTIEQSKAITQKHQISDSHLRFLISSLASTGKIEIIKRGTYVVTSPLFTEDISPFAIAAALVNPMAIAYWSACAYHGFTNQNPIMIQAVTPKKVVTPEMRKGKAYSPRGRAAWRAHGLEYEFINISAKQFWGFDSVWVSAWHQVNVVDRERTTLDLIIRSDIFGGITAAIDLLEIALEQIDISQLVQYAVRYKTAQVTKRLGWVLEKLGVPDDELTPLIEYPASGYYKIDTKQTKDNASVNERWRVIENLKRG